MLGQSGGAGLYPTGPNPQITPNAARDQVIWYIDPGDECWDVNLDDRQVGRLRASSSATDVNEYPAGLMTIPAARSCYTHSTSWPS
jgi:hypothetical protein